MPDNKTQLLYINVYSIARRLEFNRRLIWSRVIADIINRGK